jgi:hypothetical protein
MQLYYSASTNGFYNSEIHKSMPEDAVKITQEQYDKVFDGQSEGLLIAPDSKGFPVNVKPSGPTVDEVKLQRHLAYSAPGGSDAVFLKWQRGEATKQEWLDAVQAINDANPYPA